MKPYEARDKMDSLASSLTSQETLSSLPGDRTQIQTCLIVLSFSLLNQEKRRKLTNARRSSSGSSCRAEALLRVEATLALNPIIVRGQAGRRLAPVI